ncbi:MAG: hypothetical protein PHF79_02940 [Candidatus Pacebacteria bacterium]|nr:hypothetical protein [Candidatus Paceibacterota bacterium]
MCKRGPKPKGKINIKWSADFVYGLGLLASDGNLSPDGRHISFVSTDLDQIKTFLKVFKIRDIKIGKTSHKFNTKTAFRVQFGDILFYRFLLGIGFTPNKSKTIGEIKIPDNYFYDFLRGSYDGDGTFYSYWDRRWKSSHMFYLEFISASRMHMEWIRKRLNKQLGVVGHVVNSKECVTYQLKYAKKEALEIIKKMYYTRLVNCLARKRLKIERAIAIEEKQQQSYI